MQVCRLLAALSGSRHAARASTLRCAATSPPAEVVVAPLGRHRKADVGDTRHRCPCCGSEVRGRTARQHLGVCAPDARDYILAQGPWPASAAEAFAGAAAGEAALLAALKRLRFREGRSWEEAAAELRTTVPRLRGVLRRDSLSISLVRDAEPVEVVFESEELLVLAKPPDLRAHPVHRFEGGSLLNRAAAHVGERCPVPCVVHRLDQDTSGVMLFVKQRQLAGAYAQQFALRTAVKEYRALCLGTPPAASFWVDAPIARHPAHAPARMLASEGGKPARTRVRVEAYRPATQDRPAACLVRCTPLTGRTHQIRLHLAGAGLPIVLDPFYGPSAEETAAAVGPGGGLPTGMTRQALHAAALQLRHHSSGEVMSFEAALPADMCELAVALGLSGGGAVVGEEALGEALGVGGMELSWEGGTCVPVVYRDDPQGPVRPPGRVGEAAEEEEEEEEA